MDGVEMRNSILWWRAILGSVVAAAASACTSAPPTRIPDIVVQTGTGPKSERRVEVHDGTGKNIAEFFWYDTLVLGENEAEGNAVGKPFTRDAHLTLRTLGVAAAPANAHVTFEDLHPMESPQGWTSLTVLPHVISVGWRSGTCLRRAVLCIDGAGELCVVPEERSSAFMFESQSRTAPEHASCTIDS